MIHLRPAHLNSMKKIKIGTNFTIFLLFFGVALLEAFQTSNWLKAAFWLVIGIVFLLADNLKRA
jgi:hypothetical protein